MMTPDSARTSMTSSLGPETSLAPRLATREGAADVQDDVGAARVGPTDCGLRSPLCC